MAPMLLPLAAGCAGADLQAPGEAERAVSDDASAPAWPKSRLLRRVPKEGGQPETLDTGPTAAFIRHLAMGPAGPVLVGRDTVWTLTGE